MTARWSDSKNNYILYIGDNEGACHILDTSNREFLIVYRLFKGLQHITQLIKVMDPHADKFYIVAISSGFNQLSILHEINQENKVKCFKMKNDIISASLHSNIDTKGRENAEM